MAPNNPPLAVLLLLLPPKRPPPGDDALPNKLVVPEALPNKPLPGAGALPNNPPLGVLGAGAADPKYPVLLGAGEDEEPNKLPDDDGDDDGCADPNKPVEGAGTVDDDDDGDPKENPALAPAGAGVAPPKVCTVFAPHVTMIIDGWMDE